jgi:hypothetical protein
MAALEEDEFPVEFKSTDEEDAFMKKIETQRESQATTRRMTMMGGMGVMGPQEHIGFFKLNADVPDCAAAFAKRAGGLLSSIQHGLYGASFRPLVSSVGGYEWVFKVSFDDPCI